MMPLRLCGQRLVVSSCVVTLLIAATGAVARGQGFANEHIALGANSRGYIGPRLTSTGAQTFSAGCATSGFLGGFDLNDKVFDPGNVTLDEESGCSHSGWTGTSIMSSSPGVLRSLTSVAVTDAAAMIDTRGLIALSRVAYLDEVFLSALSGALPDSVRFSFDLNGSVSSSTGPNSTSAPTANFDMIWDNDVPPALNQGSVDPTGAYSFAFAVTPGMIGRWVPFTITLQTFAGLSARTPGLLFNGSETTDYSHTLALTSLDYLQSTGTGAGLNVTADVDAQYMSGATYPTATPEPSTTLLVASGLLSLCGVSFKRRRTKTGTPPNAGGSATETPISLSGATTRSL